MNRKEVIVKLPNEEEIRQIEGVIQRILGDPKDPAPRIITQVYTPQVGFMAIAVMDVEAGKAAMIGALIAEMKLDVVELIIPAQVAVFSRGGWADPPPPPEAPSWPPELAAWPPLLRAALLLINPLRHWEGPLSSLPWRTDSPSSQGWKRAAVRARFEVSYPDEGEDPDLIITFKVDDTSRAQRGLSFLVNIGSNDG